MSPTSSPDREYKIALLGFGNVGQALVELLLDKKQTLKNELGILFRVVGIASGSHGAAVNPKGFPLQELLTAYRSGISLDDFSEHPISGSREFIKHCGADVLFETTPVNYQTGQPALDFNRLALESGPAGSREWNACHYRQQRTGCPWIPGVNQPGQNPGSIFFV